MQASRYIKPGAYPAKVIECEPGEGDAGNYLKWTFAVTDGPFEGMSPKPYYTTLAEGKLWNVKKVLAAIGHEGADSDDAFDLDPADVIDAECVVIIDKEVYEGRRQSLIVDFGDEDDIEDAEEADDDEDEDEDDKPAKGGKKGGKKKPADEDEDEEEEDEEVTEESLMEMDEDDLEEYLTESELEVDLDDYATISKKRKAVVKAAKKAKLI